MRLGPVTLTASLARVGAKVKALPRSGHMSVLGKTCLVAVGFFLFQLQWVYNSLAGVEWGSEYVD